MTGDFVAMNDSKFRLFDEALSFLPNYKEKEAAFCIKVIREGQRFFLPADVSIVNFDKCGGNYGMDVLTLPYPSIALLSDCYEYAADGTRTGRRAWTISCCLQNDETGGYFLVSITRNPGSDKFQEWAMSSLSAVEDHGSSGKSSIGVNLMGTPFYEKLNKLYQERLGEPYSADIAELGTDVTRISNLIAMLSLKNVTSSMQAPPEKLNVKRKRSGKRPLYSYHILNVDGNVWDGSESISGLGAGVRSHLRRGHIRRISDDHAVWVRATFVHGSVPGFVDKDYHVSSAA